MTPREWKYTQWNISSKFLLARDDKNFNYHIFWTIPPSVWCLDKFLYLSKSLPGVCLSIFSMKFPFDPVIAFKKSRREGEWASRSLSVGKSEFRVSELARDRIRRGGEGKVFGNSICRPENSVASFKGPVGCPSTPCSARFFFFWLLSLPVCVGGTWLRRKASPRRAKEFTKEFARAWRHVHEAHAIVPMVGEGVMVEEGG